MGILVDIWEAGLFQPCSPTAWLYSSLTLLWQIPGFSSEFSFSFISSLPSLPRSKCSASSVDFFQSVIDLFFSWSYPISPSASRNEDSLDLFWWCFLITWLWWWWLLLPVHLCKNFFVIVSILMIDFLYFWGYMK